METPKTFGIIAGNGSYPLTLAREARKAGVERIVATAFDNETRPEIADLVDEVIWLRVGQLGKMIAAFAKREVPAVVMAGQIAPGNLFDFRPDLKALVMLGKLKERNAESIFGAIGDELHKAGVELLPATTFLDDYLAIDGHIAGPKPTDRQLDDVEFGFRIAKEVSRLDIGQTVVVRHGTVLAVEAFEGTNEAIKRGGRLGRKGAVLVKVSKPDQDFRFDVPVIGKLTLETAAEAEVSLIAVEAGGTLLLERDELIELASRHKITIMGRAQ